MLPPTLNEGSEITSKIMMYLAFKTLLKRIKSHRIPTFEKNFDPLLNHVSKLEPEIKIQVEPHPTSDLENKMSKIEI